MLIHLKNDKNVNASVKTILLAVLIGAALLGMLLQDKTVARYQQATEAGDVSGQLALAETLLATTPDALEVSYHQLDMAKAGFERLKLNSYEFASPKRLKDARDLLQIAPDAAIARLAYQYFWPGSDLAAFRDQGPLRKTEAEQFVKVLDTIHFDNFDSLGQSYAALAI